MTWLDKMMNQNTPPDTKRLKESKVETVMEVITLQVRNAAGLDEGSSSGVTKKSSDSRYIFLFNLF